MADTFYLHSARLALQYSSFELVDDFPPPRWRSMLMTMQYSALLWRIHLPQWGKLKFADSALPQVEKPMKSWSCELSLDANLSGLVGSFVASNKNETVLGKEIGNP